MQYKSGLNKIAMPQPWQAIAQRFCSIKICREATESVKLGFHKVKIMAREVKWTKYLWLSLLLFGAFMLEYFSIFVIEFMILHVDIWNKNWVITFSCLICCKILTFIDWHTLKVFGEVQGKNAYQFCAQYLYYLFEVMLVTLIIMYGQKAIETLLKKESPIPFGGIILAVTWGAFHFVSRGAGLEIWNGISTMIFSVLSGVMYLRLNRKCLYSYLFIAVGYLL